MTLEELKDKVERKENITGLVIICDSVGFIAHQYLDSIKQYSNKEIVDIDVLDSAYSCNKDIFSLEDTSLFIFRCDSFDSVDTRLKDSCDLIIICKKITKESEDVFSTYLIKIPKLEEWQMQDYIYSFKEKIESKNLDHLIKVCNNDIFRMDSEISKLSIFTVPERSALYSKFMNDGALNDLSSYSIFDFTNSIMKHDKDKLRSVYAEMENIDIEPLGVVTILYNNFKNVIKVQLSSSASPETCGIPAKQFWAIKYSCGYYNRDQLIKIFLMLTSIDKRLKTGELPVDCIIDYVVTFISNLV